MPEEDEMTAAESVDYEAVTEVQQRTWSEGDFSRVGANIVIVAENLAEAANVRGGDRVLDVACGAGNGAIAAARRSWEPAVGLDYVPALLERARERAAAERLETEFVEGDAQKLPFDDASFDVVLSIFGAMFAPDHQRAADELLRVCRPGGTIAMANWTPEGFIGQMFQVVGKHAPPPPGLKPPVLWGTEDYLRELFGDRISSLATERRLFNGRFRDPDHMIGFFRAYFGPTKVAFERVGDDGADALEADLRDVIERANVDDRTLVAPGEYLEVIAVRS
jgi:ubiquinone/menaquinone biosynthesis C-methylase UbiE